MTIHDIDTDAHKAARDTLRSIWMDESPVEAVVVISWHNGIPYCCYSNCDEGDLMIASRIAQARADEIIFGLGE